MPLRQRVERIAREVYGADGVDWAPLAVEKAKRFESDPKYADYCTMRVPNIPLYTNFAKECGISGQPMKARGEWWGSRAMTSILGIRRRELVCSMGSWVGPSSPT